MFYTHRNQNNFCSNTDLIPVIDLRFSNTKNTSIFLKVLKKIIYLLIVTLLIVSTFLYANAMSITGSALLYTENEITDDFLITNIVIDPKDTAINAVGIYLNFSTSTIMVSEINLENSFCKLFIQNIVDENNGQIKILCGLPTPGVAKKSQVAQIKFQKKQSGWASLSFDKNSQILANDGLGTDVLGEMKNISIFLE